MRLVPRFPPGDHSHEGYTLQDEPARELFRLVDHSLHRMRPMIQINDRISLDENELQFDFIRASGPGGQNVNKVSTAVRLQFDVKSSPSLPEDVRQRLIKLAGRRVGADGVLALLARSKRTQEANRTEAIDRLVELVQRACERPKPRRETRPTLGSKQRRLETKRRHGANKARRRSLGSTEE
jgi:ribosome-associated protein